MTKINTALSALALTALAVFTAPGTAQAAAPGPASSDSVSMAAPDGNLWAWDGINRGGVYCYWAGDDSDWNTCSGSSNNGTMRNRASSLENRGYAGSYDDVNLYWTTGYGGARNCLPNGYYLNDLSGIYFLWDGNSGQGQSMNNNISGHRWANC
ncbi:hypothetical protein KQY30_33610 [Streptomyces sp. GMY02]|uniref:hypothetical protein n=1 Tax=Streptomyces sp. GMY02 TaxID=1333528 RepID=UPI001C2C3897|nr:hypothetical protein [Streptomyces sp. GMY02]QXE38439.1 hypothetical protein KQY30_33610 [Streptomyces sp. GMY02]